MFTENGVTVDLDALNELLRKADVLTIGFAVFPARLLIDTRTSKTEGPLVAIVAPVTTVQERYLWLGKHRGNFGAPEAFSFFIWPHPVRSLASRDILRPLIDRLEQASGEAGVVLAESLRRLQEMEDEAIRAAIRGEEPWKTVWQRAA